MNWIDLLSRPLPQSRRKIAAASIPTKKMGVAMTSQDNINRHTWTKASSMLWLDMQTDFIPGEREAFTSAIANLRGRPILELGVGTGRTIPFTAPLASDYRALDYLANMVDSCRARYPALRIDLGDARTLEGLPDNHFGLVTFAFNGIDAVSHADRAQVLRAARRVLVPGGVFFFSTFNLDGPEPRKRPWTEPVPLDPSWNPLRLGVRSLRAARWAVVSIGNWLRMQSIIERGDGYVVAPMGAHDFGILAHYTTLSRQLDELAAAGFERGARVFSATDGAQIDERADTSKILFFHIVATARTQDNGVADLPGR